LCGRRVCWSSPGLVESRSWILVLPDCRSSAWEGVAIRRSFVAGWVLDLVESGRKVVEVAARSGISAQSIYTWRRQDRMDAAWCRG
jgi:hypothetical protein